MDLQFVPELSVAIVEARRTIREALGTSTPFRRIASCVRSRRGTNEPKCGFRQSRLYRDFLLCLDSIGFSA